MSGAALWISAALWIEDARASDASAECVARHPFGRETRLT
jgi:hypothetical protein